MWNFANVNWTSDGSRLKVDGNCVWYGKRLLLAEEPAAFFVRCVQYGSWLWIGFEFLEEKGLESSWIVPYSSCRNAGDIMCGLTAVFRVLPMRCRARFSVLYSFISRVMLILLCWPNTTFVVSRPISGFPNLCKCVHSRRSLDAVLPSTRTAPLPLLVTCVHLFA